MHTHARPVAVLDGVTKKMPPHYFISIWQMLGMAQVKMKRIALPFIKHFQSRTDVFDRIGWTERGQTALESSVDLDDL